MKKLSPAGSCARIAVVLLVSIAAVTAPRSQAAATNKAVISQTGQSLSSVFEGLKPNPALQPDRLAHYQSGKFSKGINWNRLPGLTPVHFTQGGSCPVGLCAGNFTVIEPDPSGCANPDCSVNDFFIDPSNASCNSGEIDEQCGDGSGPCCANAIQCFNNRGC